MLKKLFNTKNKTKQEQAKQEALKKEQKALREKVENLAVEYNSLTHKRFITIKNLEKTSLKNEVVSQASGGYSGSFLGASGNYHQNDKIVGAGIVYFVQTTNSNVKLPGVDGCAFLHETNTGMDICLEVDIKKMPHIYDVDSGYIIYRGEPYKTEWNMERPYNVEFLALTDMIRFLKQLKNDFSSVEIMQKQITDIEGKPAIEFKESGNEDSYYDICYPNTLYLNQEDWNKIIGI